MCPPQQSRRSILRAGGIAATTLAAGSLAGCVDSLGNLGSAGSNPIDDVPPVADALFTVDMNTFLADDGVRTTYNAWLEARAKSEWYDGPTTLSGTLENFAQTEGFDLRDLSSLTAFFSFDGEGGLTSNDGTGYIFEGSWDEATVLGIVNHEYVTYTESTYNGHTIHEGDDEYAATVGVIADGKYVLGGPDAVRGAIDVAEDDTDPLGGPVADAYRATDAGPVRFATSFREDWVPEEVAGREGPIDLSSVAAVETVGGSIYRRGNTRGLEVTLNAPDGTTATEIEDVLTGLLTLARHNVAAEEDSPDYLLELIEDTSVERSGSTVTATVERTVSELETIAAEMGDPGPVMSGGAGGGSQGRDAPTVSFAWDYDADAGTVTITHQSGDTIPAAELYVRGENLATAAEADMTESGPWAGTSGDAGAVAAGDSVVVGVDPDYRISLVWQGESQSAILEHAEGPEA